MPSSTSATSTNSVITSAVKNSEMAAAAMIAIDMDSSMVIRFATRFSRASLKMGQPPTNKPAAPITLMARKGSHKRHHTAAAATATSAMRSISCHSMVWSCSASASWSSDANSISCPLAAGTVVRLSVCSAKSGTWSGRVLIGHP